MEALHVLIVEDSEDDAELVMLELRRGGYDPVFERVDTPESMKSALEQNAWDLIIADYSMPHFNGIAALELTQETGLDLPFIVVSGAIGEEIAVETMRRGAHDYIMKGNLARLVPAVERELREAKVRKDRKEAERALRESEEKYRSLIEGMADVVYTCDTTGRITSVNKAVKTMLGFEPAELIGRNFSKFISKGGLAKAKAAFERVIRGEESTGETILLDKYGNPHYIESRTTPVIKAGKVTGIQGVARDSTERKQAEEALRESEERYRNLVEMAPDGIVTMNTKGVITGCNQTTLDLIGYSREEYVGKHFSKLGTLRPRDIPRYFSVFNSIVRGNTPPPIEFIFRRKDGTTGWGEARFALLKEKAGKSSIQMIARDITERKLAAKKEEEHIRDLTFLSETAMDFVELSPETDIYQFTGKKMKELAPESIVVVAEFEEESDTLHIRAVLGTGKHSETVSRLIGQKPDAIFIKATDEVKRKLIQGKLVKGPEDLHGLSGGMITKDASHALRKILGLGDTYARGLTAEGHLFGAIVLLMPKGVELENRDVAETFVNQASVALQRRRAEEQIKSSLAEKEMLLKEIHHRVKNNLQIISSLLHLQSGYLDDEQTLQMFKESQSRITSMALIHEKLYQSRKLARVDIGDYVRELASYLFRIYSAGSYGITLRVNIDDIMMDMDEAVPCGLIVNELVSNSLKHGFSSGDGHQALEKLEQRGMGDCPHSERCESEAEIYVDFRSDNDGELILTVGDDGVGFPKDLDFRKTESLGLRLVNNLVDQLDGSIKLDRSGGTAFTITFPQYGE